MYRTVTGDRTLGTIIRRIYDWPPLAAFLAAAIAGSVLFPMADPDGMTGSADGPAEPRLAAVDEPGDTAGAVQPAIRTMVTRTNATIVGPGIARGRAMRLLIRLP